MTDTGEEDFVSTPPVESDKTPRILMVEDHVSLCNVIKQQLERDGFRVDLAHSIKAASELLDASYEAVVLDIELPDGEGFDLVSRLRAMGPVPTPVVMITGNPSDESLAKSLQAGLHELLVKPFRYLEFRAAVRRAVDMKQSWREQTASRSDHTPEEAEAAQLRELETLALSAEDVQSTLLRLADSRGVTKREGDVLACLLAGRSNAEITHELGITDNTVKYHVRNLLTKFRVESRRELLVQLLQELEERQHGAR